MLKCGQRDDQVIDVKNPEIIFQQKNLIVQPGSNTIQLEGSVRFPLSDVARSASLIINPMQTV